MDIANQVVQVDLTAAEQGAGKLPAGKFDLLRIDSVTRLPGGGTMTGTLWTDRGGEVLKNREPMEWRPSGSRRKSPWLRRPRRPSTSAGMSW